MQQRVRDRLTGAAIAVVVLLVALVVLGWMLTRTPGDGARPVAGPSPTAAASPPDGPPADLGDDETWLGDLTIDAGTVVTGGSPLHDVRAVAGDVRTGPDGTVAGRLSVDVTVPFEEVARQLGPATTVRASGGSRATVERTVRLAGRELRVVATGRVGVEDGRLVVEPTSIDVGGPAFLADAVGSLVRRFVDIEHEVEGLPEGLVLQDVAVRDDGFRAALTGENVRLVP